METKKFAVIGHPIGHTMSPFIHTRLFELQGVKAEYTKLDIAPENLEYEFKNTLSKLDGFNITIPHKQAVIPFLDEIDAKAEMYGSVNTVSNKNGISKGYTTDPDGFLKALDAAGILLNGRIVVFGCGGVARTGCSQKTAPPLCRKKRGFENCRGFMRGNQKNSCRLRCKLLPY